jgi:L-alanine-DL-glutamate epimerase-like enolase superfamily enzyme
MVPSPAGSSPVSAPVRVRVLGYSLHRTDVRLRMPFRYGIATLTDGPVVFVRLRVWVDGREAVGIASDLLPPKWFTKVPGRVVEEEVAEMLVVIRHACELAVGREAASAFAWWRGVYAAQVDWAGAQGLPPLLANFGVSLVERALIEAVARATGQPLARLVRGDLLGIRLGAVHPELEGKSAAELLPPLPLDSVLVRHTVGLSDPLTEAAIPAEARLGDGLPQSLEASVRAYGLRHFKIKVNGDLEQDLGRLTECADVLGRVAEPDHAFSLDGNEQFRSLEQFREFWEAARARPRLREFLGRLLFVEQPLHRGVALGPEAGAALAAWPEHPPMIIDESDAALEDVRAALALGYAGTSHKNCKGVFKGLAHRCLIEDRRRREPGRTWWMSGEDLCNTGPVALLQDLAVMATLGIESVERNGHHYHAGLSKFPASVQEAVLAAHGDLYHRSAAGWPTLRVERGRVALGTVIASPFGVGFGLDCGVFQEIGGSVA